MNFTAQNFYNCEYKTCELLGLMNNENFVYFLNNFFIFL